jgi:hypothetical protein
MLELLFGSIPSQTILILGQLCLGIKVLAWYIDPSGIESTNIVRYPYPIGIGYYRILIIDT